MNSIIYILSLLFLIIQARIYEQELSFLKFRIDGSWIFITKMTLKQGQSQITFETDIRGQPSYQLDQIELRIIKDDSWNNQLQKKCKNNQNILIKNSLKEHNRFTQIIQIQQETTYYFVLSDCDNKLSRQYSNSNLFLKYKLTIMNHDTHLSSDDDNAIIFPLMLIICFILALSIQKSREQEPQQYDLPRITVLFGITCEIAAIIWKGITFLITVVYGKEIFIFDLFYLFLHTLSQTILMVTIILIGYGWTINYQNAEDFTIIFPIMLVTALSNVVVSILNKINDSAHDKYHMYDTYPAYILIFFRFLGVLCFIVGIIMTYRKAHSKKKFFVFLYGFFGLIYIASMPIFVYVTQCFIHINNQKEFIFLGTEIFGMISFMILTYMLISKKSPYRRITYQNTSFIENQKFF